MLVLQFFLLFVALPLAAIGVPIAGPVTWLLLLVVLTLVVVLSQRGVAIVTILLGLAAAAVSFAFGRIVANHRERAQPWWVHAHVHSRRREGTVRD